MAQSTSTLSVAQAMGIIFGIVSLFFCTRIFFILYDIHRILPKREAIELPHPKRGIEFFYADGTRLGHSSEGCIPTDIVTLPDYVVEMMTGTRPIRMSKVEGSWWYPYWLGAVSWIPEFSSRPYSLSYSLTDTHPLAEEPWLPASRRAARVFIAQGIEARFTDQEMIEADLDREPFLGDGKPKGIEVACRELFGKEARDLTLEEAALIRALQGPGISTPYLHPGATITHMNATLSRIANHESLDLTEAAQESPDRIKHLPASLLRSPYTQPLVSRHLKSELDQLAQSKGLELGEQYLKVITTLDPIYQNTRKQPYWSIYLPTNPKLTSTSSRKSDPGKKIQGYWKELKGILRGSEAWRSGGSLFRNQGKCSTIVRSLPGKR